jgi:hypothetical protein
MNEVNHMAREAFALVGGIDTRSAATQRPADGDVIITGDDHIPHRYSISQAPGMPQVALASRDEALAFAETFARCHAVDVWVIERLKPIRVVCHRPPG